MQCELTATERKRFIEKSDTPESSFSEVFTDESAKNRQAKEAKLRVLQEKNEIFKRKTEHDMLSNETRLHHEEMKLIKDYELQLRREFFDIFRQDPNLTPVQVVQAVNESLKDPMQLFREELERRKRHKAVNEAAGHRREGSPSYRRPSFTSSSSWE